MASIDFSKIKGLIFDYGGTIDTSGDHWSEIIWDSWQKAGVAADKAEFRECYVFAERELARTLHILPHHNFNDLLRIKMNIELQHLVELGHFSPEEIDAKAEEIAGYCYESAKASVAKSADVLEKLSQKYPIVLVSNFYGNISTVLQDFGIAKYFKKIIESAVVGVRKPDPEIFRLGVSALSLPADEVLVIGDSYKKDIEPARRAGCQAIWLKGRQWSEDEETRLDESMINSLDELLALLED